MHEESADKFNPGNSALFPLPFFTVIFHIVGNGIFVHANNTVIADSNSMCIFSEIVNDRLCAIEGFLTMRDPVFFITGIQQFFENIMIAIFFATPMKYIQPLHRDVLCRLLIH